MSAHTRMTLVAGSSALLVLFGLAACSKPPADSSLDRDLAAVGSGALELAPNTAKPQLVVSAVEAGPRAAPTPAAHKIAPRPTPRPTPRVAANNTAAPAPAPTPRPVETVMAPSTPSKAAEPAPLPPAPQSRAQGRQAGTYSSEAEVFRKMPWIKP